MHYMTHAKHGKMPVFSPTDIAINQKNGWVLESATKTDRATLEARYLGKFGKKPHHKMKLETIQAKLDE